MNKRILMVSTAAIALAMSCGALSAQEGKGGGAPAASSGAPSGGAVSPGAASGAASTKGDVSVPNSAASERGSVGADNSAAGARSGATAQDNAKDGARQAQDDKADNKAGDARSGNKSAKDASARDNKNSTADKSNANEGKTTGNAATSATAAPPAEKRGQIASAFKQEKIAETTNVNFNISVGARVPASVHFYPVPERIVSIYPEWRGYEVIFVHGRYIIVRPETHDIVYIIES